MTSRYPVLPVLTRRISGDGQDPRLSEYVGEEREELRKAAEDIVANGWRPAHFMTDKCRAQVNALKKGMCYL